MLLGHFSARAATPQQLTVVSQLPESLGQSTYVFTSKYFQGLSLGLKFVFLLYSLEFQLLVGKQKILA